MSVKQGVFGALLGLLNFSLKYTLLASSVFYVALASYHAYLEGSSYLGASLYILFFFRFFGLLLVPNSNPISPSLRLLGHTGAKVVALVLWACGIALLLRENYQDTVFLREVVTTCMSACIFLILPVAHLEATGGDRRATCDTALETSDSPLDTSDTALDTSDTAPDTSDTVVAVVPSDQGRGRSIFSAMCSYWKKVLAIWFVLVCVCSFSSQPWEGRINTSANGIMGKPMVVNNTTIVNDICLIPPELPTTASLTMPRIPHSTSAYITSIGTPFQVTPTRTQPSPIGKSTWVPAAMPTTMPTPEPTPTALPDVEPDPEPEPAPQAPPDIAAALQDISDAFKLMVELFTAKAKSVLPPQVKSALSWYLSLRFEDRCVGFVLSFLFAWALFTGLVAVASVISGPAILPLTCLTSTGVFFCIQHYGVTRNVSIIICVVLCAALTVAIVMADFLAYLLRKLRLLGSHAAEVPRVKADVSRITSDLSNLIGRFDKLLSHLPEMNGEIAEVRKKLLEFMEGTNELNAVSGQRFRDFSSRVNGALACLSLIIGGLGRRLTALEFRASQFRTQMEKLSDSVDLDFASLGMRIDLSNNHLGCRIEGLGSHLGKRIEGLGSHLGKRIKEILKSLDLLTTRVEGIETELREKITEHKAASDEKVAKLQNNHNSLYEMVMGILDGRVIKEYLKKELGGRLCALSREVSELATSLGRRVGEVESQLQAAIRRFQGSIDSLNMGHSLLSGICTATTERVNQVVDSVVKLENTVDWLKGHIEDRAVQIVQAFLTSKPFSEMVQAAVQKQLHDRDPSNTRSDPPNNHHGTDETPNGSSTGGHPQDPNVEAPSNTRSDPPNDHHGTDETPNGSSTGGHPQEPDGTAPDPPTSENGGSNPSSNPGGNASGSGNNGTEPKRGCDMPSQEERRRERLAVRGLPICPNTGRVTDRQGRTVACVIPLPALKKGTLQDKLKVIGSVVGDCNPDNGRIRATTGKMKPIAQVRIPGETQYESWIQQYGDGEQGAADDGASTQSSGGDGSSSASRDHSPSSHTPDTSSPPSSPAGPSSDGPGRPSFCGPPGSPTSQGGPGLPSDPSGSSSIPGGAGSTLPPDVPGPSGARPGSQPSSGSPGSPSGGPGPSSPPDGHSSPSPAGGSGVPGGMVASVRNG